jgi:hypothetical protein
MSKRNPSSPHTAGPWILTESGAIKQKAIIGQWDDYICQMPFSSLAEAEEMGSHQVANARLIATAPELLDRCKGCLADAEVVLASPDEFSDDIWKSIVDDLRQIIAKAEGRD